MKKFSAIAQAFILTSFSFSALSLFAVAPVQAASFRGLGFLYSSSLISYADDVSADGSIVVGTSSINNSYYFDREAFRWTQESGMVGLGSLGGSNFYSSATGISADGSIIVGTSVNANGSVEAFRWTPELGQVNFEGTYISDVSANGSVMVGGSILGEYYFNASRASRWTQETGFVALGNLGDNSRYSTANAASTDGSVVVGFSGNANGYLEAFRWTQQTGMVGLGSLIGNSDSYANGVSADGSIIVGESNGQAFRWTQETGMVDLGSVIGSANYATDVSADGSIIVGSSNGQGFRWTQSTGKVSLKETLIGAGLDVSGWTLYSANAISADGFTIVGYGANPSGQQEAWVAKLSPEPIPEPLTILGSIAAIAFAARFERKFSKNKSEEKDPDA